MDVSIIVSGNETSLSDGVICRLDKWDGLGLNGIARLSSQGPQQRGDTDRGFRVQARFVTLVFVIVGQRAIPESDLDEKRGQLLRLVRATGVPPVLKFTKRSGEVKYLAVEFVKHEVNDRFARAREKVGVVFKASEPDFYLLPGEATTFGQSGGSGGFVVPVVVPMAVGSSTLAETKNIEYPGTAPTFPQIRITGPLTDALIQNLTTGELIDFDGVTIAGGDWVDIDLRYGFKQALDQDGVYVQVSEDSDLNTFHLAPDPEAPGGVNTLAISGSGATGATRVDVSWLIRDEML